MAANRDIQEWIASFRAEHSDPFDLQYVFPDWVPEPFRATYRRSLTRLSQLGTDKTSIAAISASYRASLEAAQRRGIDKGWSWYPQVPPDYFEDAAEVARISWCIEIGASEGEIAGLKALWGPNASGLSDLIRGRVVLSAAANGGRETQRDKQALMHEQDNRRLPIIAEVAARNPHLSITAIAELVAIRLAKLDDRIRPRTIRERYGDVIKCHRDSTIKKTGD